MASRPRSISSLPSSRMPVSIWRRRASTTGAHCWLSLLPMPEDDRLCRSARALPRALAGQTISLFETAYAPLASVSDQSPVAGRTVEQVESRGKWLLIHFSGDLILTTHMLMSGSWHIYRVGERWKRARSHMRIVLGTPDFLAVAFDVPVARFYTARALERFGGGGGGGGGACGSWV